MGEHRKVNNQFLGKVDLFVEQGFYSNRTDFLKTSIRHHPCKCC
ncbi:hypothetical protein [Metabacillus malikii]